MPRVNPYRPHEFEQYQGEASTSGAILFVAILAAVILAAIVWASYTSDNPGDTGQMSAPQQTQTAPALPRTPAPATPSTAPSGQ